MGFYSWVVLVFLMKESKKRRRKQQGKMMVSFTAGQFARSPALNEPPDGYQLKILFYAFKLVQRTLSE